MLTPTQTPTQFEGSAHIAIVVAKFNETITKGLEQGAKKALSEAGIPDENIKSFHVPGSVEIPLATKLAAKSGKYNAIICLGAIIKGETKHDEYIASLVTHSIKDLMLEYELPITLGVLTCQDKEQAIKRSRDDEHNRGYEAVVAALQMITLIRNKFHQ